MSYPEDLLPSQHYISVLTGNRGFQFGGSYVNAIDAPNTTPAEDGSSTDTYSYIEGIAYSASTDEAVVFDGAHRFSLGEAINWYYGTTGIKIDSTDYDFPKESLSDDDRREYLMHTMDMNQVIVSDTSYFSSSLGINSTGTTAMASGTVIYYAISPIFLYAQGLANGVRDYAFVARLYGNTAIGQIGPMASEGSFYAYTAGNLVMSLVEARVSLSSLVVGGGSTTASAVINVPNSSGGTTPETRTVDFSTDVSEAIQVIQSQLLLKDPGTFDNIYLSAYGLPKASYASDSAYQAAVAAFTQTDGDGNDTTIESSTPVVIKAQKRRTRSLHGVTYYQLYHDHSTTDINHYYNAR